MIEFEKSIGTPMFPEIEKFLEEEIKEDDEQKQPSNPGASGNNSENSQTI